LVKTIILTTSFFLFHNVFSQDSEIELLTKKMNYHISNKQYDSLIHNCLELKSLSNKKAKELDVNYYLADAYFRTQQYQYAVKYSSIYLRTPSFQLSYHGFLKKVNKRKLCYNLFEMYKEHGDYLLALKYLHKIDKKYNKYSCGTSKRRWKIHIYEEMILCYSKLNKLKSVEIYNKKIDELK
jgi:tetratricopeptide (TPR) repeat protein